MNENERTEDWFLAQLDEPERDIEALRAWLNQVNVSGKADAYALAELLQETLAAEESSDEACAILYMRAGWAGSGAEPATFRKQALAILGSSPESRAIIDNVGFDDDVSVPESLRRLDVLRRLEPGVLCYDKTWGGGVVENIDWFYKRVDIDFEHKSHHQMSFAYAAETLEVLDEDHLLAMRHNDPDGLQELVKDDPAEVVRIALRSFGPLSVPLLQEQLVPRILPEADWKRFWDHARKELKADPLVNIPTKRTLPIELLDAEKRYDAAWAERLLQERGMKRILEEVETALDEGDVDKTDEQIRAALADRLAFVVKGAEGKHPDWVARALVAATRLELDGDKIDLNALWRRFLDDELLLHTLHALAARYLHDFMEQLHAHDPEVLNILLRLLPRLEMTALNEAMDILLRTDRGEGLRAVVRDLTVETQTADAEVLYWLMRNPEYLAKWELGSETDLASWVVRALDKEAEHEHLKAQNQLRARFGQKEWLEPVLKKMEPAERRELVRAIRESRGWSGIDRRGLLGRIIKMYPELESVVADRRKEDKPKASTALPLTAARSYTERQRQLERIVSIEIPEVAKEIGVAREYGDLRENFEYKAAKDKQALLLRRQGEIEDMLHKVRPSDFTNIDTATVAQGTTAVLRYDDGSSEQVTILGVWDRDEDLHIISSDSRLAQALLGRKAGERVEVPSEDGTRTCELVEIKPLSDAVRAWITAEE